MNRGRGCRQSCAIWHDGALGDLLISLPAMGVIRRASQGIHTLIARGEPGRFVERLLAPRSFLSSDATELISLFYGKMPRPLLSVDKLVLFTRNPKGELALSLARLLDDSLVIIDSLPQKVGADSHGLSLYAQEYNQAKQIFGGDGGLLSNVPVKNRNATKAYWALHPGSGGIEKCWPIPYFEALIHGLRKRFPGLGVRVILGQAEMSRLDEFSPLLRAAGHDAMVAAPLDGVFEVLGAAKFYVGNDSGISHLAALCGTESFVIFGPTEPAIWAPPFPWVHAVARPRPCAAEEILVEEVLREITKTIST